MGAHRRAETEYFGPCCGERLEYIGYYRCTTCGKRAEIGQFAQPDDAVRIRRERAAEGRLFDMEAIG